jgi:hypothetical protein
LPKNNLEIADTPGLCEACATIAAKTAFWKHLPCRHLGNEPIDWKTPGTYRFACFSACRRPNTTMIHPIPA